jgi:DNA repair exonuclease SbcCD ATPase subunit
MVRKAKVPISPEEKKQKLLERLQEVQLAKEELPKELASLSSELDQIRGMHLPLIKEIVQEELDQIREEMLAAEEAITMLQDDLKAL